MNLAFKKSGKEQIGKVIMIGVDGADWKLINPWIEDGHLKHLSEIISEGTRGTLLSTIPPFTLPAWTSIFTGVNPGKHGITDNLLRIGNRIKLGVSGYRRAPLLWSLLSRLGLESIVLNDPVTYPPEPLKGLMVTGFLTPPDSDVYTFPAEIKAEVDKASGGYMPELPLDYDWLIAKDRQYACQYINYFAQKTAKLALHMIENHEWSIFNVTFTSTDRLQHFYWHDRHLLREHYIWLDSVIGTLLNHASNEEADTIILSDHGFGPLYKNVYVNSILAAEGLIQTRNSIVRLAIDTAGLKSRVPTSLLRQLKLHDGVLKLIPKRLRQMLPLADPRSICSRPTAKLFSAAGIFIEKDLCDDYEETRDVIIHKLLSLKDGNKNVFAGAFRPEEVIWGPFTSRAPDLLIVPHEGYHLSTAIKGEILGAPIQPNSGVRRTGDHRMEGIFIANGPNIEKGHKLDSKVNTWDVAPTILHLFGAPVPSYMDGAAIRTIFRDGGLSTTARTEP